jgi:hypothetical protein
LDRKKKEKLNADLDKLISQSDLRLHLEEKTSAEEAASGIETTDTQLQLTLVVDINRFITVEEKTCDETAENKDKARQRVLD